MQDGIYLIMLDNITVANMLDPNKKVIIQNNLLDQLRKMILGDL